VNESSRQADSLYDNDSQPDAFPRFDSRPDTEDDTARHGHVGSDTNPELHDDVTEPPAEVHSDYSESRTYESEPGFQDESESGAREEEFEPELRDDSESGAREEFEPEFDADRESAAQEEYQPPAADESNEVPQTEEAEVE
jgi:hypothetical protein